MFVTRNHQQLFDCNRQQCYISDGWQNMLACFASILEADCGAMVGLTVGMTKGVHGNRPVSCGSNLQVPKLWVHFLRVFLDY